MSVRAAAEPAPTHQTPTIGRTHCQAWRMGAAALDVAGARPAEIGGQITRSVYGSLGEKQ